MTVPDGVAVRVDEVSVPGILANDPDMPRTAFWHGQDSVAVAGHLPGHNDLAGHASGLRIHTSDITGISMNGIEAYVFGHALIGATTYGFRLHLVDAGEPGTSDRFELVLANGYTAGIDGPIQDGNIQIH